MNTESQIRFTMPLGSRDAGRDRRRRWTRVARLVVGKHQRGALPEWVRRVCDQEAYRILNDLEPKD